MRYLGIDYGTKKIGLALSDDGGKIAFAHSILANTGEHQAMQSIRTLIQKEKVERIIIGMPSWSGKEESVVVTGIRELASKLTQKCALPVEYENELLTTRIAESQISGAKDADAAAAAVILQSYLDRANARNLFLWISYYTQYPPLCYI